MIFFIFHAAISQPTKTHFFFCIYFFINTKILFKGGMNDRAGTAEIIAHGIRQTDVGCNVVRSADHQSANHLKKSIATVTKFIFLDRLH